MKKTKSRYLFMMPALLIYCMIVIDPLCIRYRSVSLMEWSGRKDVCRAEELCKSVYKRCRISDCSEK